MNDQEYDNYIPEHPELIPPNRTEALKWVADALALGIQQCDKLTFLKAWWAFAWLNPGFHPDDFRQWGELPHAQEFTTEAFRRNKAGDIDDDVLYAADATHNAVWLGRCGMW
jgi:hypothetical protein